ncbi:MAG: phage baseplate assembly protein V, partial [Desulfohalobiaceae bacterium]
PLDRSGRKDGKASCWLRMIQPYSGPDHGMHFPLHKGCEVVLNFIDGDPNRPIIAGAAPNPDNPSQVNNQNQTMSKITTSGGNKLHIEDQEGSQRMLMQTPTANTWLRLGTPNDPPEGSLASEGNGNDGNEGEQHEEHGDEEGEGGHEGASIYSNGWLEIKAPHKLETVFIHSGEIVLGGHEKIILGNAFDVKVLAAEDIRLAALLRLEAGPKFNLGPEETELRAIKNKLHTQKAELAEVKETMVQECEELKAQTNLLAENCNQLIQDNNALTQANNRLSQANEELSQQNSRLSQDNEELSQSVQKISEMETTLAQMQDGMAEQWSYIFQNETTISETKEELASNSTALATSIEELAGDKITV